MRYFPAHLTPRLFAALFALLFIRQLAVGAAESTFDRTRHKSALIALLTCNPTPQLKKDFLCQYSYLSALCRMFVQEGGYDEKRVPAILEIRDPEIEAVALLFQELDRKITANATPRTLQMASAIALAYTVQSSSGIYAAMHAARLVEADPDNDAIARAAYSLVTQLISGEPRDKNELLKIAALNADDEKIGTAIRAVAQREWRQLPDERTGIGRLCRALHIWYRAKNWREAERSAQQLLNYHESRRFLMIIAAAYFDLPELPEDLIWEFAGNRAANELWANLYALAQHNILIPVPRTLVIKSLPENSQFVESERTFGDEPAMENDSQFASPDLAVPSNPRLPSAPRNLSNPQSPSTVKVEHRPRVSRTMEREKLPVAQPANDYLLVTFPSN